MKKKRINKILIPNRGEIAVRIQRTCRELDVSTVAVFSDPDRHALHVRYADEAYPLHGSTPQETYLNQDKLFRIAEKSGADAVHPGYGFLSENAEFAEACRKRGLIFIGPPPEAIEAMGEKTHARRIMENAGVPVVPGVPPIRSAEDAVRAAEDIGFPVLIKAAAGGGGKGMRRVDDPDTLIPAFEACRREAVSAFGDDRVYMEKFLKEPHHVEFQILADEYGNVVHLFERECSVQRRHQKIIEETPSPFIDQALREKMGRVAVKAAAAAAGYRNAGTVEFLVDADKSFFFLEMNTRLQVEHPVTEMVAGIDVVEQQIRIAEGGSIRGMQIAQRGASMECRIYAEDPWNNFMPAPGIIRSLTNPGGPGVRNDTGVYAGFAIPMEYDPLISKLVTWGENREQARRRMLRALEEYHLIGIRTNIIYLRKILMNRSFMQGKYSTRFIDIHQNELLRTDSEELAKVALAAAAVLAWRRDRDRSRRVADPSRSASSWKRAGTSWRFPG